MAHFAPALLGQSLQHLRCQLVMRLVTQLSLELELLQRQQHHSQHQSQLFQERLQSPHQQQQAQQHLVGRKLHLVQVRTLRVLESITPHTTLLVQQQTELVTGLLLEIMFLLLVTQQPLSH
jgi:hypothetical protein